MMDSETFQALLNIEIISTIVGLGFTAWVAGYAGGFVLMVIRRVTSQTT